MKTIQIEVTLKESAKQPDNTYIIKLNGKNTILQDRKFIVSVIDGCNPLSNLFDINDVESWRYINNDTTSIELIANERAKQLSRISVQEDVKYNTENQLSEAASNLLFMSELAKHKQEQIKESWMRTFAPLNWDQDLWIAMCKKPYEERLVIAGALIAAELDRINYKPNE